jgi:Ca2+-transporting ATPase
MDTFAALALATDPLQSLLYHKPTAPLFSVEMYTLSSIKNHRHAHFPLPRQQDLVCPYFPRQYTKNDSIVQTLCIRFCADLQLSETRQQHIRWLNKELVLHRDYSVSTSLFTEIPVIVFIGGAAFQVTRIGGREWGISLALSAVSMLVRLMPNASFERLFIKLHLLHSPEVLPTTQPNSEWNFAINRVRDNIGMFADVRRGRVRSSSFVIKSCSARLQDDIEQPTLYVHHISCCKFSR